jgi:sugar lactone lactonase YvrE
MKVFNFFASILLSSCVFLAACSKKHDQPFLNVSPNSLNLAAEGQTDSVSISSSDAWQLVIPASASTWLFADKTSSPAGTTTVKINAVINSVNAPRTAIITITSANPHVAPVNITVTQDNDVRISFFGPVQAPGGASITVSGWGFSPVTTENVVKINGVVSTVQSATNTQLTATVPFGCDSGPIEVTVGGKSDLSDYDFIYAWTGVVTVVSGNSAGGYQDGPATSALFYHPDGIEFDATGNLYVSDYANYKVRKIAIDGTVSTLPGRIPAWNYPSGPNTDFGLPCDVTIDPSGNVFVVEINSNSISKISGGTAGLLAGGNAAAFADGIGTNASFYWPTDIVMDATRNMYISDMSNHRIRKMTPGGVVTTIAGSTQAFADGTGSAAKFNSPMGIDIDASGNLIVADYYNNRIRKVTPAGTVTTIAGNDYFGSVNGTVSNASFAHPREIAIDANGVIYVAEADSEIRRITPNGRVNSIIAYVEATTGQPIQFNGIYGMAIDASGKIYVSDYYNNRICKLIIK